MTECTHCGDKITEKISYPKTIELSTTNFIYSGGEKKPEVSVIDADGNKVSSSNYDVYYAKGRKSVGTYKVTVKFKGDLYSGSRLHTLTSTLRELPSPRYQRQRRLSQ